MIKAAGALLIRKHSRNLSESRVRAVQCYDCPTTRGWNRGNRGGGAEGAAEGDLFQLVSRCRVPRPSCRCPRTVQLDADLLPAQHAELELLIELAGAGEGDPFAAEQRGAQADLDLQMSVALAAGLQDRELDGFLDEDLQSPGALCPIF